MVTGPLADNSLFLLDAALKLWTRQHNYQFVGLPWVVPTRYTDATRPSFAKDIVTPHGAFVASGEQSFLQLWQEGQLPAGPGYVGWTPCVRDEPVMDRLHQFAFIKAEVFVPLKGDGDIAEYQAALAELLLRQEAVFRVLMNLSGAVPGDVQLTRESVDARQTDILLHGVEVGSYGWRRFEGRPYLYGTALALPRFALALAAG